NRPKYCLLEHMNVVCPFNLLVQARGPIPVVVARGQEHRERLQFGERLTQELGGVRPQPVLLVQIPSAAQRVDTQFDSERTYPPQRIPKCPLPNWVSTRCAAEGIC